MENNQITLGYLRQFNRAIIGELKKQFKWVAAFAIFCALLGLGYAILKKTRYEAKISFFLNEKDMPMSGGLAGLAGQFFNMGMNSEWPSEDKIKDLVFTRRILAQNLFTAIEVSGKKELMVNHFIDINHFIDAFQSDTILADFTYFSSANPDKLSYKENHALNLIIKFIKESNMIKVTSTTKETIMGNKGGGIIGFEVQTKSEVLSKEFAENLLKVLSEFYIKKAVQREQDNYLLMVDKCDSLKMVIEEKELELASFNDRSLALVKSQAGLTKLRLQRDLQILNVMYAEVLKNKEAIKFSLDTQTPIFQIIDAPEYPLNIIKPSAFKTTLIGLVVGMVCATFFFIVRFLFFNPMYKA
ncbi:MAG: Wzz/FepE/Etk N-terminal domain-containing protein [Bacteroidota bacterium]|jgi:hypothetical protein|nr:hypothetical protein [Sphingobacteriales bacterium]